MNEEYLYWWLNESANYYRSDYAYWADKYETLCGGNANTLAKRPDWSQFPGTFVLGWFHEYGIVNFDLNSDKYEIDPNLFELVHELKIPYIGE